MHTKSLVHKDPSLWRILVNSYPYLITRSRRHDISQEAECVVKCKNRLHQNNFRAHERIAYIYTISCMAQHPLLDPDLPQKTAFILLCLQSVSSNLSFLGPVTYISSFYIATLFLLWSWMITEWLNSMISALWNSLQYLECFFLFSAVGQGLLIQKFSRSYSTTQHRR